MLTGDMLRRSLHDSPSAVGEIGEVASRGDNLMIRYYGQLDRLPKETEEVLYGPPELAECAVFGIPDPTWGEVPAAYLRQGRKESRQRKSSHAQESGALRTVHRAQAQ